MTRPRDHDGSGAVPVGRTTTTPQCSHYPDVADAGSVLPPIGPFSSVSHGSWLSTLSRRVLATRTHFAAFLKATLHLSRVEHSSPAKALFPLPVPKPGSFARLRSCASAKLRRQRAFDQALHIVVMALNFLHNDCSYVPLGQIRPLPNPSQRQMISHLARLVKAFGCRGDFPIPACGRRTIHLSARLSEPSSSTGAASAPYLHGVDIEGSAVLFDTSVAEELRPYRSLNASRLKLSGKGQWDPTPWLPIELVLAFREPESISIPASPLPGEVPDISREDRSQIIELARKWDSLGLLHLSVNPLPVDSSYQYVRIFNAYKSSEKDRQIGDRRGRNPAEGRIPGASRYLPTGPHLAALEINPSTSSLSVCMTDRSDFYHQLAVSPARAETNKLGPPIPSAALSRTNAYGSLLSRLGLREPREKSGDYSAGPVPVSFLRK